MTGGVKLDLSRFRAGVQKKLSDDAGRQHRTMFDVASFVAGGAKDRAPFLHGILTADVTGKVETDGGKIAAVIYVPANGASASYAVDMHEGVYHLGKLSLAKQARVNVTVGPRFITRTIDDNREKIRNIIDWNIREQHIMSLYQRGNVWWANFTVRGKRYQFSTGQQEKKKAQEWERQKVADLQGESSAVAVLEKIKAHLAEKQATFQQGWDFFTEYPRRTTPSAPLQGYYHCVWFDYALG